MAKPPMTENEIQLRIAAKRLHWPESGTSIACGRLHECVDALHGLVRVVDDNCRRVEQDVDLSPEGMARRRTEFGRQTLKELANFKSFQVAQRAVTNDIDLIEKRMNGLPPAPEKVRDVLMAQEIRQYVRGQKHPIDFALKTMSDPRILGAILDAPAPLSGLSDSELKIVRERARTALHPEQVQMQQLLTKALDELREGVAAAKRAVVERCGLPEEGGGTVRESSEPRSGVTPSP